MPASFCDMSLREVYDVINAKNRARAREIETLFNSIELAVSRAVYAYAPLVASALLSPQNYPPTFADAFPDIVKRIKGDEEEANEEAFPQWKIEKIRMQEYVNEYRRKNGYITERGGNGS